MKRLLQHAGLLVATAALGVFMTCSTIAAQSYLDVQDTDWFAPAVEFTTRKGLLTGVSAGIFDPEGATTRAMFYTVLARSMDADLDGLTLDGITDVDPDKWYAEAAAWAVNNGIANATNGVFGAEEPITRAELCRALVRCDRLLGGGLLPDMAITGFLDVGSLDEETAMAVNICHEAGIVSGRPNGLFEPLDGATRAEMAQILTAYFSLEGQQELEDVVTESDDPEWMSVTRWTGDLELDFPLCHADEVTEELVNWLNLRIISENYPARVVGYGQTIDGNPKHLTNYGLDGYTDCWNVATILYNQKNDLEANVELNGQQQYYGYSLQVDGVSRQDSWHQMAQLSGKDPWQCTWWVWGRASQYLDLAYGLDLKTLCGGKDNFGHGGSYYRGLSAYFESNMTPEPNSIVSWSGGEYGHVAYVEAVDENGIWVSAADSGHSWRGVTYIPKGDDPNNPYPLYWHSYERCNGFNHLDTLADGTALG